MSQEFGAPSAAQAGASLTWGQVWIRALTRPSVETFEGLVSDPKATSNRAYTWVFISALIGFAVSMLAQLALTGIFGTASRGGAAPGPVIGFPELLVIFCGAPVGALLSVLGLMISAGISQAVAGALGGTGSYSKLVYAFAAYLAPLTLISSVIGSIPLVNCLAILLGIYSIVLNVIAVKAVNQFGWGKAIASSLLILALILVLVAVVVIVILALLGPAIGNVFSNIIEGMSTPAP